MSARTEATIYSHDRSRPDWRGAAWLALVWGCLGVAALVGPLVAFAYHLSYGADDLLLAGIAAFCAPAAAGLLVGGSTRSNGRLARLGTLLLVLVYLKTNVLAAMPLPGRVGIYAVLAVLAAFALFARVDRLFGTIANALLAAGSLCVVSFPIAAWILPPAHGTVFGDGWLAGSERPRIFLVLDEFDPAYAGRLAARLSQQGAAYRYQLNAAAGHDTLNAIPAMLTGRRFDDAFECAPLALCGTHALSLASLTAVRHDVDVVAFWHPYCAIAGLRSCYQQTSAFSEERALPEQLACIAVPFLPRMSDCWPHGQGVEETRKRMLARVDRAPFWRLGGLLYVHVPLPHPTGEMHGRSLKAEYEDNVGQAVTLVDALLLRARARFGRSFEIDVTADHPLRVKLWCSNAAYASPDCGNGVARSIDRVPFFVISDDPARPALPASASNVGILR